MIKIKRYKLLLVTKPLLGNAVSCVLKEGFRNESNMWDLT